MHKTGHAYDENIGAEIISAPSGDPRYYSLTLVDLAMKVKKTIPTKHQKCKDTNYDEKLLEETTEKMMSAAGKLIHLESSILRLILLCEVFFIIRLCSSLCGQNAQLDHL